LANIPPIYENVKRRNNMKYFLKGCTSSFILVFTLSGILEIEAENWKGAGISIFLVLLNIFLYQYFKDKD
jgi:hypothetical protein